MRNLWLVWVWIAALFVLNATARAHTINYNDPNDPYYQITEVKTETISVTTEKVTAEKLEEAHKNFRRYIQLQQTEMREISHPFALAINPYVIAQILFKAWDIVLAGKSVVSVEAKNASALPVMADYNWAKLTGWHPERVVKNKLIIKNLLGMEPISMDYAIKLMFGGSAQGRGMYIASARVVPSNVKVLWGYDLDVAVNVPNVVNVSGRDDDPIAQITLEIKHKIQSRFNGWVIKKSEMDDAYKLQGDGYFLDYKKGIEHFEAVYHPPAPPLPSPSATPEPILPTDPETDPLTDPTNNDDPFATPTPAPTPAKSTKLATKPITTTDKPVATKPGREVKINGYMKVRTRYDQKLDQ